MNNPGGRSARRGGGRGGRNHRGGDRRPSLYSGRPISRIERMMVLDIWHQINDTSRSDLLQQFTLREGNLSPVEDALVADPGGIPPIPAEAELQQQHPPQRRIHVWERPIIRDIPIFQQYGQMTPAERALQSETSRLLSVVTGVIGRGAKRRLDDDTIRQAIESNLDDVEALKLLYKTLAPVVNAQPQQETAVVVAPVAVADAQEIVPAPAPAARLVASAAAPTGGKPPAPLKKSWGDQTSSDEEDTEEPQRPPRKKKKGKRSRSRSSSSRDEMPGPKEPPKGGSRGEAMAE